MHSDDVYPFGYDRERAEGLGGHYTDLQLFYEAAAHVLPRSYGLSSSNPIRS